MPDVDDAIVVVAGQYLEGVDGPPTNLEAVGRRLNVLRFEAEPLPISGELRREQGGFVVVYSSYLSSTRRRFTIAHELAHAMFERSGPNCPRTGRELERLCDMLATELLMPREEFLRHCGTRDQITWTRIRELSSNYQVSLSATALRCAELLGLTVFEVEDNQISWAYGAIRRGPITKTHPDLQVAVANAKRRDVFDDTLYVNTETESSKWWEIKSKAIGQDGRVMFLMIPKGHRLDEEEIFIPAADHPL